jgi:hypothetical protein
MKHAWKLEIVNIIALTAQKAGIFDTFSRMAQTMDFGFNLFYSLFMYPVHRQRLPEMAWRMSSSVGCGFRSSKADEVIIIPGVQ